MKIAFIFPGQGSQYVGMGKVLAETYPEAKAVFETADQILGFSLSRLLFEGPEDELMHTDICQPGIFTHSMAVLAVLKKEVPSLKADVTAGLSLGEYSALTYAGAISFEEGLKLVRTRGQLMQAASEKHPGGLASIMGLDAEKVEFLCKTNGAVVANLNSPDQVVVAGELAVLEKVSQAAQAAGAKRTIPLKVAGAFHSPLMDDAAAGLEEALKSTAIQGPTIACYSNLTGELQKNPADIRGNLREQVNHRTRWIDCFQAMRAQGVEQFVEIGPGKVLKGLARKIDRQATVINVEDPEGVEALSKK